MRRRMKRIVTTTITTTWQITWDDRDPPAPALATEAPHHLKKRLTESDDRAPTQKDRQNNNNKEIT
jgi:hypothetical protein